MPRTKPPHLESRNSNRSLTLLPLQGLLVVSFLSLGPFLCLLMVLNSFSFSLDFVACRLEARISELELQVSASSNEREVWKSYIRGALKLISQHSIATIVPVVCNCAPFIFICLCLVFSCCRTRDKCRQRAAASHTRRRTAQDAGFRLVELANTVRRPARGENERGA